MLQDNKIEQRDIMESKFLRTSDLENGSSKLPFLTPVHCMDFECMYGKNLRGLA